MDHRFSWAPSAHLLTRAATTDGNAPTRASPPVGHGKPVSMSRPPTAKPTATMLAVGIEVEGAACCATLEAAAVHLREVHYESMLAALPAAELLAWPALAHAVLDTAVVAVLPQAPDDATQHQLLERGVQDVVVLADTAADALRRRLEIALQRKTLDRAARRAFATDLATGLPNHAQLLEHMTHLLALRDREPAPMAVIALRVDDLARVGETLGIESSNVLRRKVAVRLRASLRASDVVASIGNDAFVVLLAWIDSPADGERVMQKLAVALHQPFSVAGTEVSVKVHAGLALYPDHGKAADALLRRSVGQASSLAAMGGEGTGSLVERGRLPAANDDA